jgi:hypothetical protein
VRPSLIDALPFIERQVADVVHGSWQQFGLAGDVVVPPAVTVDALVPGNSIDGCALIARDVLERVGGWDESLAFWEDWDLWFGIVGVGGRTHRIDDVTFDYLVRPASLSSRATFNGPACLEIVERVVTKHATVLGPTIAQLVLECHRLIVENQRTVDAYRRAAEAHQSAAEAHDNALALVAELEQRWAHRSRGVRTLFPRRRP